MNEHSSGTFTNDDAGADVPSITSMDCQDGQPLRAVTLRGTARPNADVSVLDWLTPVASVWSDGKGRWEITIHCARGDNHMFTVCAANGTVDESRVWLLQAETGTTPPEHPAARHPRVLLGWKSTIVPGVLIACELAIIVIGHLRSAGTSQPANRVGMRLGGVVQKRVALSGKKTRASHKVVGLHASARGTWIFTRYMLTTAEYVSLQRGRWWRSN